MRQKKLRAGIHVLLGGEAGATCHECVLVSEHCVEGFRCQDMLLVGCGWTLKSFLYRYREGSTKESHHLGKVIASLRIN